MSQSCTLYRHFDAAGGLLYVGISINAVARLASHRDHAPWFPDIRRVEFEVFPNREMASKAEQRAIRREKPVHNRQRYIAGLDGAERSVVGLPAPLVFIEAPAEPELLLSRLKGLDGTKRVQFPDACRVLGLSRVSALRLVRMPADVTCPLEAGEMHELAHRVAAGTAVIDPPSWKLGNLSTSPEWTVRLHGSASPLYDRSVAVAEGRFHDAAWMFPAPLRPTASRSEVPA